MCLFKKSLDTSFETTSDVQFSIVPLSAWLLSVERFHVFCAKFDEKIVLNGVMPVNKW